MPLNASRRNGCRWLALPALCLALAGGLAAAEPVAPADTPPLHAPAPNPAAPVQPGKPAVGASTQALIDHLAELRGGLADEDKPTRDKASAELRQETEAILEALFRVPPDEDTPDERKLLAVLANQLQVKLQYEQYLLKIPARKRNQVDAMLKKSGGADYLGFLNANATERDAWFDKLVAAKPDADALAEFICSLLDDKDSAFVTKLMTVALEAAPQVGGKPQVPAAYLEPVGDLLKKGYIALYVGNLNDPQAQMQLQMRMQMMNRGNLAGDMQSWNAAAVKLVLGVPGERSEKILLQLLETLASPEQMQMQMQFGQQGNPLFTELGEAMVERKIQAAFPALLKGIANYNALQMGASFNGGPTMYSSPADQLVYFGYRLLDSQQPKRDAGRWGSLNWQSNAERLKFYDGFLAAWQAAAKNPNREGYAAYEQWYQQQRPQLVNAAEQEAKVLEKQGKTPDELDPE